MTGEAATDRRVYQITGEDRVRFLQDLITNDIGGLKQGLVYAALLSPQGKYLADFFLAARGDAILLDLKTSIADATIRRLTMYKLRAKVTISSTPLHVQRGLGPAPADADPDPRHPLLGWRRYADTPGTTPAIDWDAVRVTACVPETGIELIPDDTYILEAGFERLHGVDFRKGCYVGQEVTARMKHKTLLRKGFVTVKADGAAPVGTEITFEGKPVGTLYTQSGGRGIAYLRFDRASGVMQAGAAMVRADNL